MPENPRTPDTPASRDLPTFTVKVEGQALARAYQVLAVRVQKEANRIPTAHLVLKDGSAAAGTFPASNADLFVPGRKVEVWAGYHEKEQLIFKGLVIKHAIEARTTGTTRLNVTCKDAFVKTTLAPKRRYFLDKKDSEVAEQIVEEYSGLTLDATATTPKHEELLQYDATDWDFLVMRAEANGMLCLVDDGKLTITKPKLDQAPVTKLQFGATVLDFDAEIDARNQLSGLTTTTWDYSESEMAKAEAAEPSFKQQGNLSTDDLAEALGTKLTLQHGGYLPTGELQAWADATLLKRRLAKIRGRIRFYGNADVKPGTVINLAGMGERFNGDAYVTGVNHRLDNGNWTTDAQFGLNPQPFAAEINVSAPPAGGLLPSIAGLQIGVVTALEGDAAGEERIAVRLPVLDAAGSGSRARVLSVDAGNQRGFYFRPEVGDEVVVGFLNNDPREAVVLGGLHSSHNPIPSPFKTADANPKKGYVSRSKLQVVFDDEKKSLTLETPAGNLFKLDDEAKSITVQDQHGNKIVLSDAGITLESIKDVIIKAATDVKVTGVNVTHTAQTQFKASGSGTAEVSSSGNTTIKGAMVQIN
ncbi:type VI secretion system tip protein VgrG [Hymenobacter cavernae]|uniref:Gp5/Type VI secretion system Vgr protein OB-fold domain-containing protein n=1 Tax=Hymenobacter cavernae TaxID=2044852 RepID=A0ABQ1UT82_9BACT|nr:type VI secretion system tip protein VgrG [Hymenobacter cavernae]GGF24434.1 hypothetical protein GCM10011383_40080 [Hymenobacter cavernae]